MLALRKHGGFTLTEMVVVMGAVGVLSGLLLPCFRFARQQARSVQCASNLRAIGQGFAGLRADRKSRGPAPLSAYGWELDLLPYLSESRASFRCPDDATPVNSSFAHSKIAAYNRGQWLFDFEIKECPGWVQMHNVTPTSYELWFEDQVDTDFNDLKVRIDLQEGGMSKLTFLSREAGYHFDLIAVPSREVLISRLGEGGASQSHEVPAVLSSYGMNTLVNRVCPGRRVILALDYDKTKAAGGGDGAKDDWSADLDAEGAYKFARHSGRCNVLFADGSVALTDPAEINPADAQAAGTYWTP